MKRIIAISMVCLTMGLVLTGCSKVNLTGTQTTPQGNGAMPADGGTPPTDGGAGMPDGGTPPTDGGFGAPMGGGNSGGTNAQ